jgi:hypothetical protein
MARPVCELLLKYCGVLRYVQRHLAGTGREGAILTRLLFMGTRLRSTKVRPARIQGPLLLDMLARGVPPASQRADGALSTDDPRQYNRRYIPT